MTDVPLKLFLLYTCTQLKKFFARSIQSSTKMFCVILSAAIVFDEVLVGEMDQSESSPLTNKFPYEEGEEETSTALELH